MKSKKVDKYLRVYLGKKAKICDLYVTTDPLSVNLQYREVIFTLKTKNSFCLPFAHMVTAYKRDGKFDIYTICFSLRDLKVKRRHEKKQSSIHW